MTRKVCAWGILTLFASASTSLAAPEFVHLGVTDMGDGTFQHDYKLTNLDGAVPLYDVDTDFVYRYGWIDIKSPDQWTIIHGPMSRWSTESAPCAVGTEILGFTITAGTPTLTASPVYFTDVNHQVVEQGMAMWPETPGPAFVHLETTDMGDGTFEHDYMLTNYGGAVALYDVDVDSLYRYGWISFKSPTNWVFAHGPMSRWSTETAPCNVEQELLGFTITAGTPTLYPGAVYFTDTNHEVVFQGQTMWPESDFMIPTVSHWGLACLTLVLLAAGTVLLARRRTATE